MKFFALWIPFLIAPVFANQQAVVAVPVADLRSDRTLPTPGQSDDKQQTQLLFGETVDVVSSNGDWARINAVEQPEFTTHQKWEGYPGWVLKSALRMDHSLRPIKYATPQKNLRDRIVSAAAGYIGTTYTWGGLSPKFFVKNDPAPLTGLDCSGLTHLAYRVNGLTIPRDSMDQYLQAEKIKRADLKPADLIFSAKADQPDKISHVTLYAGEGQIIEAPQTGLVARKIPFSAKYGKTLSMVESGDRAGDRVIYFGRFLKKP